MKMKTVCQVLMLIAFVTFATLMSVMCGYDAEQSVFVHTIILAVGSLVAIIAMLTAEAKDRNDIFWTILFCTLIATFFRLVHEIQQNLDALFALLGIGN